MRKISAKNLKKLGGKMPFSSITKRTKQKRGKAAIVRRRRTPREFARIYGSKARVEFVKSLACAACGVVGYSENAHLLGNGGMGRKADADTIGPLCGAHRSYVLSWQPVVEGCHTYYDRMRDKFDDLFPDFDPEKVARETKELWASSVLEDTK